MKLFGSGCVNISIDAIKIITKGRSMFMVNCNDNLVGAMNA